ncbi:hypothetical protein KY285_020340 [Solanum tuberosum]|nr:hypothetical protein KY285_020340 [Solanum tuberosum]
MLMRFKYVPKGFTKLYNVDPRRQVLRTNVDICGALGLDLVLDDGYNQNYITPSVVAYLGLPRLPRHYSYTMEGCKVSEGVKVSFTRGEYYEKGPKRVEMVQVKNERQKIERSKGEQGGNLRVEKKSVMNGGTRVPNKEPTFDGVMDALVGCPNIPTGVSFQAFPPKDGNLSLVDESTLVGKGCDDEEGGVSFPINSSSWCVSILNGMTNDFEPIRGHTYENTIEEVDVRDTFLYYLFTYDDAHAFEWSMLLEDEGANR